ncbi:MAG: hypothetical protein K0Q57_101 [Gammaproteobacteria bacterium]|jgi:hypothetical protein|nr:hypothetical protein [Gammaproteobacteria bacterium]
MTINLIGEHIMNKTLLLTALSMVLSGAVIKPEANFTINNPCMIDYHQSTVIENYWKPEPR